MGENQMTVKVFEDGKQIGEALGSFYVDFINRKPDCVLGLATGATPVPTYQYICKAYAEGRVSFKNVKTFNLDEYCGLPSDDKNSYRTFMADNLFNNIDIDPANIGFLDGNAEDESAESERYTKAIEEAGGIDLQFLGIGRNGHIAFNEPSDSFTQDSFKVKLSPSTIEANSIYFENGKTPEYAFTMGIGLICKAKKIVLVATGDKKAQAVKDMLNGEITPRHPASVLQRHPDTVVYLDKAAASLLE